MKGAGFILIDGVKLNTENYWKPRGIRAGMGSSEQTITLKQLISVRESTEHELHFLWTLKRHDTLSMENYTWPSSSIAFGQLGCQWVPVVIQCCITICSGCVPTVYIQYVLTSVNHLVICSLCSILQNWMSPDELPDNWFIDILLQVLLATKE